MLIAQHWKERGRRGGKGSERMEKRAQNSMRRGEDLEKRREDWGLPCG